MTDLKKTSSDEISLYKTAAAAWRVKVASLATPGVLEGKPLQDRIRATLVGKSISSARQAAVFGPTSIAIPEFSIVRKRTKV
jgi:hypothetical protein